MAKETNQTEESKGYRWNISTANSTEVVRFLV